MSTLRETGAPVPTMTDAPGMWIAICVRDDPAAALHAVESALRVCERVLVVDTRLAPGPDPLDARPLDASELGV